MKELIWVSDQHETRRDKISFKSETIDFSAHFYTAVTDNCKISYILKYWKQYKD